MSSDDGDEHGRLSHDRWVISYADFITLLFALFVVLFASSTRNREKMSEEAEGMIAAFHGVTLSTSTKNGSHGGVLQHQPSVLPRPIENPAPRSPHNTAPAKQIEPVTLPVPPKPHAAAIAPNAAQPSPPPPSHPVHRLNNALSEQLAEEALALERVQQQLKQLLSPLTSGHQVTIEATPLTLTINLNAAVLFDSGKAELLPEAQKLLANIADSIRTLPEQFSINLQGYTDNQPITTAQFHSNWSLSAERAVSVVELFSQEGIDGSRLSAQGFAQYAPIADNASDDGRAKNRRVVIVIRAADVKAQ